MVALGSCVDQSARLAVFRRLIGQLIQTDRYGMKSRKSFRNKDHEREIIEMARGARKHYLGCFPKYRGAGGFGRAGGPNTPEALTRLEEEILGPDTTMLPQWSPVFSNSENFWENVNRQVYMKKHNSRRKTRSNGSSRRRTTRRSTTRR